MLLGYRWVPHNQGFMRILYFREKKRQTIQWQI